MHSYSLCWVITKTAIIIIIIIIIINSTNKRRGLLLANKPEEQKGYHKGSRGTSELLYQNILNKSKTRRTNGFFEETIYKFQDYNIKKNIRTLERKNV